MNKETIYLETSDDIADILSKIKSSDKKLIILVPPKKPTVLLSSVNIKLISRTVRAEKKTLVLVTTDDSLTKLAMSANLPVAPSLKSRPVFPDKASSHESDLVEESIPGNDKNSDRTADAQTEDLSKNEKTKSSGAVLSDPDQNDLELDSDELIDEIEQEKPTESATDSEEDTPSRKKANQKSSKKSKKDTINPVVAFVNERKAWVIFSIVAFTCVVTFFIWASMIAPKLDIAVKVRASSGNFSENISLTKTVTDEKIADGIFAVHEETLEKSQEVKFTATGQKDLGEPASGSLAVYVQEREQFSYILSAGSVFTYKGLEYVSTAPASLTWDGDDDSACGTGSSIRNGCIISVTVSIKASAPGENYNVEKDGESGWSSRDFPNLSVYNSTPISGGTSKIVTVVQQSDIDLALDKIANDSKESGENELLGKLSDTVLPIKSSFYVETTEPKASPAASEEVKEGETPTISSKTTFRILTIDKARIEEFIKDKANLEENRQIYSFGEPFIEYFTQTDDGIYSGKLKTTYKFGPRLSETEILDRIDGQKVGRIEPILKDNFPGVSSVTFKKSVFWVNKVPKNPNRVTIKLEVEE